MSLEQEQTLNTNDPDRVQYLCRHVYYQSLEVCSVMAKPSRDFNFKEALTQYYSGMGAQPSIIDDCFASAVETLARKAQTVFQTDRHNWVKKQLTRLTDSNNWHAYAMELNLCYGLETSNKKVKCGVKC